MIEGRAIIEDIDTAKSSVESLGAKSKNNYSFKDIIFVPKAEEYSLSNDFVRVRVYIKTNWPTKNVVLVRKNMEWKNHGKIDNVVLREEFDSQEEAFAYIDKNLGSDFEKGFDYNREGWEYELDSCRIFIEDIKGYRPTIEIEAEDEEGLKILFNKIGVLEIVKNSVPEIMRKKLKF
ncbi:MAG: hypothetical protein KAS90_05985 [Candidatus Aenigmarchaeota archaeon]|nr:hypothetical protein [Candidatus Aenigmarchaeota archaeon]